jgi:hypothetical protein
VRASFFFPQVPLKNLGFSWPREIFDFLRFLCEPEPEENFSSKKKAELEHLRVNILLYYLKLSLL